MMRKQHSFHPAAVEEAEAATLWYRERSVRAAQAFVRELNQVIDKILVSPKRWPVGPRDTRRIVLPVFPFIVIYRESRGTVQILAIAHGRRRPGYWKARL